MFVVYEFASPSIFWVIQIKTYNCFSNEHQKSFQREALNLNKKKLYKMRNYVLKYLIPNKKQVDGVFNPADYISKSYISFDV